MLHNLAPVGCNAVVAAPCRGFLGYAQGFVLPKLRASGPFYQGGLVEWLTEALVLQSTTPLQDA